jgi:protein-tyrosine phosphatase
MLYAVAFAVLAIMLTGEAIWVGGWIGGLLLWPALSAAALSAAYCGLGPRVFGKQADGTLASWSLSLLLPYLLLVWLVWHVWRWFNRDPAMHEVSPGLWVGRRPLAGELPANLGLVVDLTSEFPAAPGVSRGRDYLILPMLDAAATGDESEFLELVLAVANYRKPVLVHCALGHGRSAVTAAAVMLARGLVADPAEAEARLRAARPGVELRPAQRALLRETDRRLRALAKADG